MASGKALARHIVEEFRPVIKQEVANGMLQFAQHLSEHDDHLKRHDEEIHALQAQGPYRQPAPSIPPMRNTLDTGRFEANLEVLEKALEDERKARADYERSKMTQELADLKESRKWWWQNIVGWVVAGLGFVLAAVIGWFTGHAK